MAAGTELDDLQRILQTQAILRFYEYKSSLFPKALQEETLNGIS